MRKSLVYSLVGIIAVAVISLGATIASGNKPLLGLDLQGGASLVLKPQQKVDNGVLDQAISIIRKRVDALGVAEPDISRQGNTVVIELPGIKNPQDALNTVGQTAELRFRPMLCNVAPYVAPAATTTPSTAAGTATTAPATTAPATTAPATTAPAPATTKPASGTGLGPIGGDHALHAELASASRPIAAGPGLDTQATTAPPSTAPATTATTAPAATTPTTAAPSVATTPALAPTQYDANTCALIGADGGSNLPSTPKAEDDANNGSGYSILPGVEAKNTPTPRYLVGPTQATGKIVSTASAQPPDITNGQPNWFVQVNFTNSGSGQFDALAKANLQKQVAIVLDGVVVSAPTIQTATFNGVATITGNFTQHQASDLALQLRYGSLPVQFTPQSIQTVSATLGKDSLKAGLLAGAIGLALVLIYMIAYYRALGIVVVLGLAVSGAILYSIIVALSAHSGLALSLAGATGIIVSVGVTVDSYIVYFERLKDDIRSGKTVRTTVDRSFRRAYRTILAADLVSFMAAVILYLFTVGSVRGFAFFLGLSTLLDVITAYFFTRPMVVLLGRSKFFTEAPHFGVARGLAADPEAGLA
ncbi:MAG TPA: protein translocase subunit SecD [Acidimicrobiales bacterium]